MNRVDIGGLALLMVILAAFIMATTLHGIYIVAALGVLLIIILLTWRQYLPNVFAFIMIFHWCQIVTYILFINSAWKGDLNLLTDSSGKAYFTALSGVLVMSFIFKTVALKNLYITANQIEDALQKINPKRVLQLYLILYFVSNVLGRLAFGYGSLTQILLDIALLKWAGFVLLGYLSFTKKEYRVFFAVAFILDFVGGFFSYFSSFKDVFFYTAIVAMTFISKIDFKVSLKAATIGFFLFFLAVAWTVIKGDYREFLNEGSNQQVVSVSQGQAFSKLSDLVTVLNTETLNEGIGQFFYRLQYVYHLSKVMDRIPSVEPFQDGAVWAETIQFTTVPRMFNADKAVYDASLKASRFTGIQYLGQSQGVSFSLGYFADCYVDFGIPGMFFALAVLAFIWSKIFRYFLFNATGNLVINYAIIAAFFVQFCLFESDGTFMFGRMFTTFIVFLLLKFTLFPKLEKFVCFPA